MREGFSDAPSWVPPVIPSLDDLIARVEAASGPDQGLDWQLHVMRGLQGVGMYGRHPAYTASLDAALALVERLCSGSAPMRPKMPLWLPKVARWFNGQWEATLYRSSDGFKAEAVGKTPALALLLALLRALQAEPNRRNARDGSSQQINAARSEERAKAQQEGEGE